MQKEDVEHNNSYNQIIKAFGLFGGVQIFIILINIIRSKFIAILLGTAGLGIFGLLSSTLGILGSLTNLGLNSSAILTISKASNVNDQTLISRSIINLRRWVSFTGVLGGITTLILASKLSQWVFGNDEYKLAFIWLSFTLFFQALSSGQSALLQGMRKLKQLAKVSVIGSSLGLFISLSLFYFYGLRGIVPSIILTAASTLFISWYFASKIKVENVQISMYESFYDGLDMVKLGASIAFTNLFGSSVLYLVQVFINKTGGTEQLGLYLASFAIINGYFGMIFTAMSTDLFPRIAAISIDNLKIKILINQQSIIMILILAPLLIFLISSLPFVIKLLLSSKFLPIIELLKWAILGVVFQAIGYPIGLTIAAKGHSKIYLILVIALHVTNLLTYTVFYHFLKLEGIGIAFLLVQSFFFIIGIRILQVKYSFSYEHHFIKIFLIQLVLITTAFLVIMFVGLPIANFSGVILTAASALYSYFELKKRIDFSSIIRREKL
jgi:O-antigen/teichoic acid export membrane protein